MERVCRSLAAMREHVIHLRHGGAYTKARGLTSRLSCAPPRTIRAAKPVMTFPSRFVRLDLAREQYGDRVDRLGVFLSKGDPLADAAVDSLAGFPAGVRQSMVDRALQDGIAAVPDAPEALRALFAQLDHVPFWVDGARLDRGGAAFLRAGLLGGMVLGAYSLVAGYCSPAGNKPLAFSGRLAQDAPRRLAETGRFVQAVSTPGGMHRYGDGFKAMVKVRLVHASVRRMLLRSPRWNSAAWGVPINQYDMSGTALLFSSIVLDGLDKMGFQMTAEERADFMHLWRYGAYVIGVDEELRCTTEAEAKALWDLLSNTQAPPDDDSRALANALLDSGVTAARTPEERVRAERARVVGYALSRHLLGEQFADWLGYPKTPWRYAVRLFQAINERAGSGVARATGLPFARVERGAQYWKFVVDTGLRGVPATFEMPDRV